MNAGRSRGYLVAAGIAALGLVGCGDGSSPQSPGEGARSPSPGPPASLPKTPETLSAQLTRADAQLRRGIESWRSDERVRRAPPRQITTWARYHRRAVGALARRTRLAAATVRRLPPGLASQTRELALALRDLNRLAAGSPSHPLRTGRPRPLPELLGYYRAAEKRFGVEWNVLAAVNLVESAFGRVRSDSFAGAQGPMQFVPDTWAAYGLGGDVHDPHDAILGAANYLHSSGAPASYSRALYAYNPSRLYVDAVLRFARVIARDRDAVHLLYSWRP
jgi:hypothetical protein